MQKYDTDSDDLIDDTRPPITDMVETLLAVIFAAAGPAMVFWLGWMIVNRAL